MIYLTYGDPPSGVYASQVSDVVRYLNRQEPRVLLVAFISIRGFLKNRTRLRGEAPGAWVLPILPRINYWRPSAWVFTLICRLTGKRRVIARGVLACNVALAARRAAGITSICYDGRGAIAAEWEEYEVAPFRNLKRQIRKMEKHAVLMTDYRIAVSHPLVDYWRASFGYQSDRHVIIPCTLTTGLAAVTADPAAREKLGFDEADIVLVYAGSVSGWQSFRLVSSFLTPLLERDPRTRVLFLSGTDKAISDITRAFPSQVTRRWVPHHEVRQMLAAGDYGLLLREARTTNRVAAPTKFAEYLAAGLPVLISEGIGDYTEFVQKHGCGHVIGSDTAFTPVRTGVEMRQRCVGLAEKYFSKDAMKDRYAQLVKNMSA